MKNQQESKNNIVQIALNTILIVGSLAIPLKATKLITLSWWLVLTPYMVFFGLFTFSFITLHLYARKNRKVHK